MAPFAEVGLLFIFLVHIVTVIRLTMANRAARGTQRYAVQTSKRTDGLPAAASKTMAISGMLVLAFLAVHVGFVRLRRENLFYAWLDEDSRTKVEPVTDALKAHLGNPPVAILYVVGSVLVCWHLFHGVQSAFRSLGLNHNKYTPLIEKAGAAAAGLLALLFASIPLAILFGFIG